MLREYLVDGRSVRDLAVAHNVEPALVRAVLGRAGIRVDPEDVRDPVCAAVGWLGLTFAQFATQRAAVSRHDQAKELAVSKADLERVYSVFRELALMESDDGTTGQ